MPHTITRADFTRITRGVMLRTRPDLTPEEIDLSIDELWRWRLYFLALRDTPPAANKEPRKWKSR